MSRLYRLLLYIFPCTLWGLEWLIRSSMEDPAVNEFWPPAICSAALTLLLPVVIPKQVPKTEFRIQTRHPPKKLVVRFARDEVTVALGLIALIIGITLWSFCLYLSLGGWFFAPPVSLFGDHHLKFGIGVILYIAAVGLTELKERR